MAVRVSDGDWLAVGEGRAQETKQGTVLAPGWQGSCVGRRDFQKPRRNDLKPLGCN